MYKNKGDKKKDMDKETPHLYQISTHRHVCCPIYYMYLYLYRPISLFEYYIMLVLSVDLCLIYIEFIEINKHKKKEITNIYTTADGSPYYC